MNEELNKEVTTPRDMPAWMLEDLARSGRTAADIDKLGWYYTSPEKIKELTGIDTRGGDGYAITFTDPTTGEPMRCPDGRVYVRIKLRVPLDMGSERPAKYISPKDGGVHAFILPKVHEYLAGNPGQPVYLTEGEKKAVCAAITGIPCIGLTGNWGWLRSKQERVDGKDALCPELLPLLGNRIVYVVWDSDANDDGERASSFDHSTRRLARLLKRHDSVLHRVDLPKVLGDAKVGFDDYLVAGKRTRDDFLAYVKGNARQIDPGAREPDRCQSAEGTREESHGPGLPVVTLPKEGYAVTLTSCASQLAKLIDDVQLLFARNPESGHGQIQFLDSAGHLMPLTAAQACSEFECVAALQTLTTDKNGDICEVPTICSESLAKRILGARSFFEALPPIRTVTRCPVLVERKGQLVAVTGYDRESGILAAGSPPPEMDIMEARGLLLDLVSESAFATPADKSRYLANLVTPALIMGQLGGFRAPIQYNEADKSQSGKGYLNKITAAVYNDTPAIVNQQKGGGVGSMREKFDSWLIHGNVFISFDNLTPSRDGVFNSEELCSFMTEDLYSARALRTEMAISPKYHVIMATTNGCTLIVDLVNRSCPVAIRKKQGHNFRQFPEGDLLAHVKANSAKYLAAVFAVVREWYKARKPRSAVTSHDSGFNTWAQTLDWIVQNLLDCPPLLDGYEEVKGRITSPDLMWLREMAQAVKDSGNLGKPLIATDLAGIAAMQGIEISKKIGVVDDIDDLHADDLANVRKQIGAKLARCFKFHSHDGHPVTVDSFRVELSEDERSTDYDYGKTKSLKSYRFTEIPPEPSNGSPEPSAELGGNQVEPSEPSNSEIEDDAWDVFTRTCDTPRIEITGTLGSLGSRGGLLGSGPSTPSSVDETAQAAEEADEPLLTGVFLR